MALTRSSWPAPWPIQKDEVVFGEEPMYRFLDALLNEGVLGVDDLKVSQKAAGADLSVDVAAGLAAVLIDTPYGGKRCQYNDAVSNSGTPGNPGADWAATFTSPHATLPRIDRVCLRVQDGLVDGSGAYAGKLIVVAGTATSGATLTNLTGAAAVPANHLLLANVLVAAAASTIPDANIDTLGDGFKRVRPRMLERDVICSIRRASVQSLSSGTTLADITLDTEALDLDNMWASGDPIKVYARTPGYYAIEGLGIFAANATNRRSVAIVTEDGTTFQASDGAITEALQLPVVAPRPVLLGTSSGQRWAKLQAWQNSGGALDFTGEISLRLLKAA